MPLIFRPSIRSMSLTLGLKYTVRTRLEGAYRSARLMIRGD